MRKTNRKIKDAGRTLLEKATAVYYDSLSGKALREELQIEKSIANSSAQVDFDTD